VVFEAEEIDVGGLRMGVGNAVAVGVAVVLVGRAAKRARMSASRLMASISGDSSLMRA
jgi:hypothetical protein